MKAPKKPLEPSKPSMPDEFFEKENTISLNDDNKVKFTNIQKFLPEGITIDQVYIVPNFCYECYGCVKLISLSKERNPNYKQFLSNYKKRMKIYERDYAKWILENEKYEIELAHYIKWYEEQEKVRLQKQLKSITKRLEEIKGKQKK